MNQDYKSSILVTGSTYMDASCGDIGCKESWPMATMLAGGAATQSIPIMGSRNPPSPGSNWEETMNDLSRQLQQICRSPTSRDTSPHLLVPKRSLEGAEKASPPQPCYTKPSPGTTPGKSVNVKHSQSDKQFIKQLSRICLTPRHSRAASDVDKQDEIQQKENPPKRQLFQAPKRRMFRETLDVNGYTSENLTVLVDGSTVRVSAFSKMNTSVPAWTREIDIPSDVDPTKLMCIVKDGNLVIQSACHRNSLPHVSSGLCDGNMIIIEDDGSEQMRILLPIPQSLQPEDIQVKTVDDKLIVVGQPPKDKSFVGTFSKSFQLPQSVDPFSIRAYVNDKDQLLIEATCSQRARCLSF